MSTGSAQHLHEDDPAQWVEGPDGEPITNLTAEEYAATWAEGGGHQLPAGLIRTIEQKAKRARIREALGLKPRLATAPLQWMPAYSHGGPFGAGAPAFVTVHCTEGPNGPGAAEAVAGPGWFGGAKAGTSAHKIVDVDSICEGVHRNTVAWHAGAGGNTWGIAYEFSGFAAWTAAQWREPAQLAELQIGAQHIAEDLLAIGAPARWLSVAQVAAHQQGLCTHNDVRLAFPGTTTHTDPGPNFPFAELLGYVQSYMGGPPPPPPPPSVIPKPPVLAWALPAGNWLGNVNGPAKQHGGDLRYDSPAVHELARNVQQHLIYKGCVAAVPSRDWRASGWDDGVWGAPTDVAMTLWHQRFYPGQQYPAQCWKDDFVRLTS